MRPMIVLATDDPEQDERIARAFRDRCCDVTVVSTASQAVHLCRSRRCDIVVSRVVFMAGLNGVELAELLAGSCSGIFLFSSFPDDILQRLPGFPPAAARFYRVPGQDADLITDVLATFGQTIDRRARAHPPRFGTWEVDLRANTVSLSPEYYSLFGLQPTTDASALEYMERRVHPDDRELAGRAFDAVVAGRGSLYRVVLRIIRPDGGIRRILVKGTIEYDRAGRPIFLRGVAIDESEL